MAFGLRFTDGTTTVTVTTATVGVLLAYKQGNAARSKPTVVDKANVLLVGGLSTVRSTIRDLNRLFMAAEEYQETKMGARVYVERDLGDSVWWRSEITEALPLPDAGTLDTGLAAGKMEFELVFSRKNFWEGAETQAPLTNGNGTNNTTGLTVQNHDDSGTGHDNFVSIASSVVDGDLPAPARIEMVNSFATNRLFDVWIGQNWTDPANFPHILEAEDASGGTTVTPAAAYSNNAYKTISVSSGSEIDLFTWTLSTAMLNAAKGGRMKALFRFDPTYYANVRQVWYRLKASWQSSPIWQSERAKPSTVRATSIRDLFSLRLPPWLPGSTSLDDITLTLTGYQNTGSALTIGLDFLQLTPADGWRYLTAITYGVANGSRLVDDAITGELYVDNASGADKIGSFIGSGDAIHLKPGKLQRLYFLMHSSSANAAEIDRTMAVKVFFRPRRFSL